MNAYPGRAYRLTLALLGASDDLSWLPSALSDIYPVEVVSVGGNRQTAVVVLKWTGPAGTIAEGLVVRPSPAVAGMVSSQLVSGTVEVIEDLGPAGTPWTASPALQMVGAIGVLVAVLYLASRIRT